MRALLSTIRFGMLLCDVPTPALILDHSTAQRWCGLSAPQVDATLNDRQVLDKLATILYVHTTVVSGRDVSAGAVGLTTAIGAETVGDFLPDSEYEEDGLVELACLDCSLAEVGGGKSFVGLGLNNHLVGGYYWGRASGPGAAMPAPGVKLIEGSRAGETRLLRVANSNDGKRSEWCEFLRPGDQLQVVPHSPAALLSGPWESIVGVCRVGDGVPPGAEPRVDAAWQRESASGVWTWSRVHLQP